MYNKSRKNRVVLMTIFLSSRKKNGAVLDITMNK